MSATRSRLRLILVLFFLAIAVLASDEDLKNTTFNKRQSLGTGNSNTATSDTATTDTTPTSTIGGSSTPPPTSSTPAHTTTDSSSSATSDSTSVSSSTSSESSTVKTTITSTLVGSSTSQTTYVTVATSSDGQLVSTTVTSADVVSSITGYATYTTTPGLVSDGSSGGAIGLSQGDKNIIGGVVGGIGGAILLGGIALVFFRLYRKRRQINEDDDMGLAASVNREKASSGALTTDAEDPLQRYQQPGKVNTAQNF